MAISLKVLAPNKNVYQGEAEEIFTGMSGKYVKLEDTIAGFNMILSGELDDLPEQAFYLVGNIDEVKAKAEKIKSEK